MDDILKSSIEVVKAQAGVRTMDADEMVSMISGLYAQLQGVEQGITEPVVQEPAVDPKKSIREKSVICLECGKSFKVITRKHLATHDLTPEEYKEKWGMKKTTSLVAKSLARERRKKMQDMQLWKKRRSHTQAL